MTTPPTIDLEYTLSDRFERDDGRVYLNGWEAIVRLLLEQRRADARAGLETRGFVSGYPGSPLGGLDTLLRRQRQHLIDEGIHFEPGLNEDLAATAVAGSQYLNHGPITAPLDGVFGLWYGKGPGLERSADAIRTASYQGVSRTGGVIALVGDDHDARSTVTAQQSETLFVHMHVPILNPASVQEYLDLGLAGWALSRHCGSWVGMIALNDTADSASSVAVARDRRPFALPPGEAPPPFGTPRPPGVAGAAQLEVEIRSLRLPAATAFARANRLDRAAITADPASPHRRLGIVASGKAYLDVLDGLERLGLGPQRAAQLGISVYKVVMPWPLEPEGITEFVTGLDEVLVVEPKHPIIEDQIGRLLWRMPADRRPLLTGKHDPEGRPLVPDYGALDGTVVAKAILARLEHTLVDDALVRSLRPKERITLVSVQPQAAANVVRAAGFCSGCPHNTSMKVPAGSFNIGGTGCHGMAIGSPAQGRETHWFTHMGGEGALWLGMAPFADQHHTFQNMGDGTYSHSGALAVRAAVAARVDMTFKILLNGYISMTGGQSIPGELTAADVARQLLAEGVTEVAVVTDDVQRHRRDGTVHPPGVGVHDRSELVAVEERLQQVRGVTAVVFDQPCAAELRRERTRGRIAAPPTRVVIHDAVCEGCGDCNVQSNCISVEPLDTDLGRKRVINQSSCNQDFTCLDGYCPSFVTLTGATPKKAAAGEAVATTREAMLATLPNPVVGELAAPVNILIGGIGGGGVLTIGALLGMAAHLEGKAVTVLNESGLAQKNGAVQSHVRIAADPDTHLSPRINADAADLVLGADPVVVASPGPLSTVRRDRTRVVVNRVVKPPVGFAIDGAMDLSVEPLLQAIRRAAGPDNVTSFDADRLATKLLGDAIYGNLALLGYAAQRGWLPVGVDALDRAIQLNGVAVDANREAFTWGRLAAHDPEGVSVVVDSVTNATPGAADAADDSLDALVDRRARHLVAYQGQSYAEEFRDAVSAVVDAERRALPGSDVLGRAAAESLFKLMAYKDEYEVARLYTDRAFWDQLERDFEPGYTTAINLAPQVLNRRDPRTGRARKVQVPARLAMPAFRLLARGRVLRGTRLDLFGRTPHRRAERRRIVEFRALLAEIVDRLTPDNHELAVQLASLPQQIRGYDTVKDAAATAVAEKTRALLDELRATPALAAAPTSRSEHPVE
jgi:indolepyruvate ferredoxin oxidoreductase